MTTAAMPTGRREPVRGWFPVPNSLIENQGLLTRPELALSLIVLRRAGQGNEKIPVSDGNWEAWTGLSPRAKEYAEAGLRKKGTLEIVGRGKSARYGFSRDGWENHVRHAERTKPRTEGRRAVDPKPGSLIHPKCREQGCAVLRTEHGESGLTDLYSTNIAQLVAQCGITVLKSAHTSEVGLAGDSSTPGPTFSLESTKVAQPVAQTADLAEQVWSKALAVLRAVFPLIGIGFLVRLVAVVRTAFADVTDQQLAQAIQIAWAQKRTTQKSEGLFLLTVPEALATLRRQRPMAPGGPPGLHEGARRMLERCMVALAERGTFYSDQVAEIRKLLDTIPAAADEDIGTAAAASLERISGEMDRIAELIWARAVPSLDENQLRELQRRSMADLRLCGIFSNQDPGFVVEKRKLDKRHTFELLAIPGLDLFYA
jgi:hypothetical protein